MKKIIMIFAIALTMAACGTQSTKENAKEMNTLTFTTEQAAFMSAIACNEAKADYTALAEAINGGLDAGLTVSQIKEALSQLYAYTGFPRSLNALGTLQKVLQQRNAKGKATEEGVESSPLPNNYNALAQGTEVQTQLSGRPFNYDFCPAVGLHRNRAFDLYNCRGDAHGGDLHALGAQTALFTDVQPHGAVDAGAGIPAGVGELGVVRHHGEGVLSADV